MSTSALKAGRLHLMLRLYLASTGVDQKHVAEEMDISPSTLCRFLAGRQVQAAQYVRILSWCQMPPWPSDPQY